MNSFSPSGLHFQSDMGSPSALTIEFSRLDNLLAHHLNGLRARGRSILGDAVGGAVIEEGEAEGILQSLNESHAGPSKYGTLPSDDWISPLEPLEKARSLYNLFPVERDLLFLALSVEIDSRYARLVAFLNDQVSETRPTLGLAIAILQVHSAVARGQLFDRLTSNGPLIRYGLLNLPGDQPLANRPMVIPSVFWPRLLGMSSTPPFKIHSLEKDKLNKLQLPESTLSGARNIRNWASNCLTSEILIIVSGEVESGRCALARAIASGLCTHAIVTGQHDFIDPQIVTALEREARWYDAAIIVTEPEQIPENTRMQLLELLNSPVIFIVDKTNNGQLLQHSGRKILEVTIPKRSLRDTTVLWNNLLETSSNAPNVDASVLARRFAFGPERIITAIQLANTRAESEGHTAIQQPVLEVACHQLHETRFGDLAQRMSCQYGSQDIVLPVKTRQELELITAWAKHGDRIFGAEGQGQALHTGKGLACLFCGPSGTGKTMAAQIIAKQVNLDLFRIDLSQVANKYIGETEKNLSRVFDEAQRAKVVLFFDEADALFGRRSEVKDAHDRYANIETGYLLQRLDAYDGLAILATNLRQNLDDAFLRRLQVVAEFPMPRAKERLAIWQRLLPTEEYREKELDLGLLAGKFELSGGDIRNAIFSAHLLAANDNSVVGMKHLILGLWRELQKSGRIVDPTHFGTWRHIVDEGVHHLDR